MQSSGVQMKDKQNHPQNSADNLSMLSTIKPTEST